MHLTTLALRQFRSHRELTLRVDPGVTLFLGDNGAGKTNIIEAIAVLATGSSPRGADGESMVQWGEDGFSIKGEFAFEEPGRDPMTLEMKYRSGAAQTNAARTIRQNERIAVRLKDLLGKVPLVSFVPEDLSLVKGEPEGRRRALNLVLMQVDPVYAEALRSYMDVMKSRNAALRQLAEGAIPEAALAPWDAALIEVGLVVCGKRELFLAEFSERVAAVHRRVSGEREDIRLEYRPSFAGPWDNSSSAARWKEVLECVRGQELGQGSTAIGPHRDDVLFLLNGRPARAFGSEGQKRTAAVSFKLAEIPFVNERLGQKPICLLDDVLSELDAQRAEHLLNELSRTGQCFVTMTGLESWPPHCARPASVFRVDETGVRRETGFELPLTNTERAPLTAAEISRAFSTTN